MSDLDTQIRSYFDANVERVTADDVFAGRRLVEQLHQPHGGWQVSPRFAVAFGFGVTAFVVAGSLGLGLTLRQPADDTASGAASYAIGSGTPASTGWILLGVAAILAVVALVFMVLALRSARRSSRMRGREKVMSTTFDTPPVDHKLEGAHRANKWLIAAVVVLAIAVVALGAWVVNDLTTTSDTEVPAEIAATLDSYADAWNSNDKEAFFGNIREIDFYHSSSFGTYNAEETVHLIRSWDGYGTQVETIGESLILGSDSTKYVVQPQRVTTREDPDGFVGFSVLKVVEGSDDGWVVAGHHWMGQN